MTTKKLGLAIALAAFAVACSDPTMPTRTLATGGVSAAITPHPIEFINGQTFPADPAGGNLIGYGAVVVCKTADAAGSFDFSMTINGGGSQAIPGGPLVLNASGTVCRTIFTSAVINAATPEVVTVTEAADQTNWALTGVDIDQYFGAFVTYPSPRLDGDDDASPARGATVYINNDMSKVITFTNDFTPPSTGCTYTKGWYRNNGSSTVIAVDGRTIAEVQAIFAATPGQPGSVTFGGNNTLLNLYQQFLAALQNLGGDANEDDGPTAVDNAIDDVQAGTDGTGLNITTTLSQTQMSALIATLSAFNEGTYTGWPHCDTVN